MRYALLLLCLPLLFFGCNRYEQENNRLKDELKMLREENNYAKAEIIGLKKELAELSARVKDERETLQKQLEEERGQMQKKIEEVRETMQKKAEASKKKKPLPQKGAGVVRKDQPPRSTGPGGTEAKGAAVRPGAQKTRDRKAPAGGSPGEE